MIDWDRTTREVMTMEWVDGTRSPIPNAWRRSASTRGAGAALIQTFLRHALRDGFFHADMHQGNFFVDAEGRIVASISASWAGSGSRSGASSPRSCSASSGATTMRVAEVHFEAGYVPKRLPRRGLRPGDPRDRRADPRPHRGPDLDGGLLTLLFEVTALFDMRRGSSWSCCRRRWSSSKASPASSIRNSNMWATAEPVVGAWIADNLGPQGADRGRRRARGAGDAIVARRPAAWRKSAAKLEACRRCAHPAG